MELKLYVTLDIPDEVLSEEEYKDSIYYIKDCLQDLAEDLMGSVEDLEIK